MGKVREAAEAGAYDDALWRELRELGWPGIAVAEEHGGQGLGAVELAVLLEELGYACAATPFLSTAVAAAVIQAAGTPEQQAKWLPGLASGEPTAGHRDARSWRPTRAGAAVLVLLDGDDARARRRARRRRGARRRSTRRAASRTVTRRRRAARAPARPTAIHAAVAAEVVGVCQRALDMTLDYVKDRKQFGVPVGSFQAVSHRCAQMLLDTESARSTAYYAAWAADADPERLRRGGGARRRRGGRRRPRGDRERDPGPRRHRLHLGGRRPLALQARPARRRAARRRRRHRAALARAAAERVAASAR